MSVHGDGGRVVVAPGVELAYQERGTGQPLVLVPGWTVTGDVFEHQLTGLSSQFRIVTFDPRSHGRSTSTATGNTYPQQGRDLAAFMDALDLDGVHLAGCSFGALAGYAYVEQHGPSRLRSFTALDMPPKGLATGEEGEWAENTLEGFLDDAIAPCLGHPAGYAKEFVHYLLDREPTPDEEDMLAAMHLGTERHAAASLMVSAMLSDYRSLAGRLSRELPFANAVQTDWIGEASSWLARHAPDSVVWPMASHMAFWDSPVEFNHRFRQFLLTAS